MSGTRGVQCSGLPTVYYQLSVEPCVWAMCWSSPTHVLSRVAPPVLKTHGQWDCMVVQNAYVSLQAELELMTGDTLLVLLILCQHVQT